jgi:hypothetical protein
LIGEAKQKGEKTMRRAKVEPLSLLAAIAETVDDGFCPIATLAQRFPKLGRRDLRRLQNRAARRGLVMERRGPDGRLYLALTSEGWQELRSSRSS